MADGSPQVDGSVEERALVESARRGDVSAFESIVSLYQRRIIAYCHRMAGRAGRGGGACTAEDLAQDVFVKLFVAMPRFEAGRPIGPLLYRIAHNHCIDVLRRRGASPEDLGSDRDAAETAGAGAGSGTGSGAPGTGMTPEREAGTAREMAALEQALHALPAHYRSVLLMRHADGMSYEDISQALDLPMGTVKARIHRGREMLQQRLRGAVTA